MQDKTDIIKQIKIGDYAYPLPEERIAKYPLSERDKSKLLVYKDKYLSESIFNNITDYLSEKSLMVFNNTRVIQARLLFKKETGAQIEIFCLEPENPADYAVNFQSRNKCEWKCLIGNQKKWKEGVLRKEVKINKDRIVLTAELKKQDNPSNIVCFEWDAPDCTFAEMLEAAGILPIPPYLNRSTEQSDLQTYQTVYSKIKGSVAAPTAGLHFTPEILNHIDSKGIKREEITLHVGAGTFKPVKSETIGDHDMHAELFSVTRHTIENLIKYQGNIIAVGTTSARTLESLYYLGLLLSGNKDIVPEMLTIHQWTPYEIKEHELSVNESLSNIIDYLDKYNLETQIATTQIIIVPGYKFKIVNGLITNFHQPKSTLLLLVSAFVNGEWKKIYDYALSHDFRFLSYGDSSLLMEDL
ncbi:MAG: S-adenosylmethionine:tRNA ribosyltransferase-isomerase [Prevotellaceae bacterium]|jgi:S-adenosylmethionine:tRNA ribosyltransferase-isomerase|nr:S-adenosylmethionine:tRNA ribosyltransferase-isomerase [Prevotellaceae bacterium]